MYNFAERITKNIVIKQDKGRKHIYQVNYTMGIHICLDFYKNRTQDSTIDIELLIRRYILPVRKDRKDKRNVKQKSFVCFMYRVA